MLLDDIDEAIEFSEDIQDKRAVVSRSLEKIGSSLLSAKHAIQRANLDMDRYD